MRGKFITFEGGEGCGKSTQILKLEEKLRSAGIDVIKTREPGGTRLSELIRGLLKDEETDPPCDRAELLLFLAARAQLAKNVIVPALSEGKWVISDRFSDSTFAYQGYGRGLDLDAIKTANDFACAGLRPDLTLLLEVSSETAEKRMRAREAKSSTSADRIEKAGNEFHARLRRGFLELAAKEPERIKRIDAEGDIEEVWERIWNYLKPLV
ncbi:MAG: dTMP kinase [Kiritimatiellae bacterium]|nr:dTMP kinase [Kiritimatiellia bacterium]